MEKASFRVRFTYFLLSIILFFYAIIEARDFLYPITLGVLASYLLFPVVNFLEKKKVPRIIAITFSLLSIIVLIYGIGLFIYNRLDKMVAEFPDLKNQAVSNIETIILKIEHKLPFQAGSLENILKEKVSEIFESGGKFFETLFAATAGTIFKSLMLPVYVFLFLFYRTKFAHFILMIVPSNTRLVTVKILRDISKIASKYLAGVLMVAIILSIINSVVLLIFGIKYAFIIGILSGMLAFIPYFGSILGGVVAFSFTLLTSPNPLIAVKIGLFYIAIVFIEHNILTPNIVGNNVRINPFIIILSLIIAATVWGIPGMLVIIPFMAFIKIIAKNHPKLKPYSFILGMRGAKRHALTLNTIKDFFKRNK